MIVFTRAQMAAFAAAQRTRFVDRMCAWLRDQFRDELWALADQELQRRVEAALVRADELGLRTERDCCRYLNLAVLYGWDFERREANAFMRAILEDRSVDNPGRRLQRLVEECLQREAIAQSRNGAAPASVDTDADADLLLPNKD